LARNFQYHQKEQIAYFSDWFFCSVGYFHAGCAAGFGQRIAERNTRAIRKPVKKQHGDVDTPYFNAV
jgi:hypothetical protein